MEQSIKETRERVIPAWAGNTYPGSNERLPVAGHPRVGGEHTFASH